MDSEVRRGAFPGIRSQGGSQRPACPASASFPSISAASQIAARSIGEVTLPANSAAAAAVNLAGAARWPPDSRHPHARGCIPLSPALSPADGEHAGSGRSRLKPYFVGLEALLLLQRALHMPCPILRRPRTRTGRSKTLTGMRFLGETRSETKAKFINDQRSSTEAAGEIRSRKEKMPVTSLFASAGAATSALWLATALCPSPLPVLLAIHPMLVLGLQGSRAWSRQSPVAGAEGSVIDCVEAKGSGLLGFWAQKPPRSEDGRTGTRGRR
jgi:hypothetical protein